MPSLCLTCDYRGDAAVCPTCYAWTMPVPELAPWEQGPPDYWESAPEKERADSLQAVSPDGDSATESRAQRGDLASLGDERQAFACAACGYRGDESGFSGHGRRRVCPECGQTEAGKQDDARSAELALEPSCQRESGPPVDAVQESDAYTSSASCENSLHASQSHTRNARAPACPRDLAVPANGGSENANRAISAWQAKFKALYGEPKDPSQWALKVPAKVWAPWFAEAVAYMVAAWAWPKAQSPLDTLIYCLEALKRGKPLPEMPQAPKSVVYPWPSAAHAEAAEDWFYVRMTKTGLDVPGAFGENDITRRDERECMMTATWFAAEFVEACALMESSGKWRCGGKRMPSHEELRAVCGALRARRREQEENA